ncbi:pilus assembly PilX N-terminal domain-containing protein [Pullulanibacillus sp. KACC 23026]|uniref:pilus assembly PilX family protein n=1 Tax=Pullulanibacillus sp. KACC 23026 TaxID=3028315 RepID=UPI0023B0F559|nr:pilus assembly PilX N-terminal domain-containing protein [Pullulanibacillus sp. KACC 23026]WEG11456.1 pilus assembly PilX N-terminal domain-containing protein [Pullulanibacillus sp. KACC 23026]
MRVGKGMRKGFGKALRQLQNQQGMALAIVLMVIVVFSILGVGLLTVAETNIKLATVDRSHQSAYYIAEAGATYKLKEMNDQINSTYKTATSASAFFSTLATYLTASNYADFSPQNGNQPTATANVQDVTPSGSAATTKQYKITSVGKIGTETATVTQSFSVNYVSKTPTYALPNMTVFTTSQDSSKPSIDLEASGTIIGTAGTSGGVHSITMSGGGGNRIDGNIYYVGPASIAGQVVNIQTNGITLKSTPQPITGYSIKLPDFPVYPSYPVPANASVPSDSNSYEIIKNGVLDVNSWIAPNYTLTMNNNMSFSKIHIGSNYTLTIDTGNTDRSIVVDQLSVETGHLVVTGSGKLTIYVKSSFTTGSGSINQSANGSAGDPNKLNIYYGGTNDLTFASDMPIYGNLYAKTADITITAGAGFTGVILTGGQHFTVSGGTSNTTQLFFAPNADFYLSNGGQIKGNVISKTFKADGAGKITNGTIDPSTLPFFPSDYFTSSAGTSTGDPDLVSTNPIHQQ